MHAEQRSVRYFKGSAAATNPTQQATNPSESFSSYLYSSKKEKARRSALLDVEKHVLHKSRGCHFLISHCFFSCEDFDLKIADLDCVLVNTHCKEKERARELVLQIWLPTQSISLPPKLHTFSPLFTKTSTTASCNHLTELEWRLHPQQPSTL